jgi:hypothetical protein
MGNTITNVKNYSYEEWQEKSLAMSNSLTAILIEILSLGISHLAKTDAEIDFAIWLASHDPILGGGNASFDISELPWSVENFAAEKKFLLRVIDSAKAKNYWNLLDYEPPEETAFYLLEKFAALVKDFTKEFIGKHPDWSTSVKMPMHHEKCSIHGVYLSEYGCVICNGKVVLPIKSLENQ